jgi:hypothetical protein
MHKKRHLSRFIAVGIVAAVGAPATAVALSGSIASAGGPTQISCTKLKGGTTTQTLKHCSGPAAIIGSKPGKGTAVNTSGSAPPGFQVGGTTTWGVGGAGGTDTSGSNITITGPGAGTPCGTKAETITETGMVVSGTGAAATLVGDSTSATVCYKTSAGTIKNAKGTIVTN